MEAGGLEQKLVQCGLPPYVVHAVRKLFSEEDVDQAVRHAGTTEDWALKPQWNEHYSQRYRRFYYAGTGANRGAGTTWDMPAPLRLQQWMVDADLYAMDLSLARTLFQCIHTFLERHWHTPDVLWPCVDVLAKLVGNVGACDNSQDKYRRVRGDNPRIHEAVLSVEGAREVLVVAGFLPDGADFVFPCVATPLMMYALRLVAARLHSLVQHKGLTGSATPVDDTPRQEGQGSGQRGAHNPTNNRWHGTPGFQYQTHIYVCSLCDRPINDGSERLFTRQHDAPHGQFRYESQQCADTVPGGFQLCEGCWDTHSAPGGATLHLPGHTFTSVHPRTTRHNTGDRESASNPWGVAVSGGTAARARQRLKDRTGL